MKVLLFVQSGNARPKCAKSFGGRAHSAMQYFARVRERLGSEGQPDRAWLVECENAEAGRDAIAGAPVFGGRILAIGGPLRPR